MIIYQLVLTSFLAVFISFPASATKTDSATAAAKKAEYPPQVKEMVLEARKSIKTIDMDGFRKIVDNPQGALIIDVREPKEFVAEHVPNAINIPRGVIEFKIWKHVGFPKKIDYGKAMYLYCKTGGRCTLAAKSLQDLGFTNVTVVVMMLMDWQKAGHPVVN